MGNLRGVEFVQLKIRTSLRKRILWETILTCLAGAQMGSDNKIKKNAKKNSRHCHFNVVVLLKFIMLGILYTVQYCTVLYTVQVYSTVLYCTFLSD